MIAALELSQGRSSTAYDTKAHGTFAHASPAGASLPKDEQLAIARTLNGDLGAFNVLVLKYQRLAYSIAYRILLSSDAAGDAVQESFIKAYLALPSFRGTSFKSWLARIVVNTSYDILRLHRRLPTEGIRDEANDGDDEGSFHQLVDSGESPQAFVERMELSAQIELGLRSLPDELRVVLVLRDIHGYSYDEISEITGTAMGTVKSRINRARLKLRDFLMQRPELVPPGLRG